MLRKSTHTLSKAELPGVFMNATVLSVAWGVGAFVLLVTGRVIFLLLNSQRIPAPRIDVFSPLGFAIAAFAALLMLLVLFGATLLFGYPLALLVRNMAPWAAVATCAAAGGVCYATIFYFTDSKADIAATVLGVFYGTLYGASFVRCRGVVIKGLEAS